MGHSALCNYMLQMPISYKIYIGVDITSHKYNRAEEKLMQSR